MCSNLGPSFCKLAWLASIALALPLAAQAQAPSTAAAAVSHADASPTMVWLGTERVVLGLGQRRGPSLSAAQLDQPERTLGVGVGLTRSTLFTFESDTRALRAHDAWVADDPHRVGLSFRTTSGSREAKRMLTVQLSGQSVLQLRPRGNGLRAVYRATF